MAKDEDIFLDMGKPVKIIDIAKKMIKFYSNLYTNKIHIKEIGLRDGKNFEDYSYQKHYKTQHERIFMVNETGISINELKFTKI